MSLKIDFNASSLESKFNVTIPVKTKELVDSMLFIAQQLNQRDMAVEGLSLARCAQMVALKDATKGVFSEFKVGDMVNREGPYHTEYLCEVTAVARDSISLTDILYFDGYDIDQGIIESAGRCTLHKNYDYPIKKVDTRSKFAGL